LITRDLKLPLYLKTIIILVGLFALLAMLYIAKGIIVPLILAAIFAIVLHPVVNFFIRLKINRVVAIIITMTLAILIFTTLGILLFSQAVRFSDSWPILIDKFSEILNKGAVWASGYFEINPVKMDAWMIKAKAGFFNNDNSGIGQTLVFVGSKMVLLILVPVYIFMILFYQPLLLEFFHRLFGESNRNRVSTIISQIKVLVQRYLVGLIFEAAIVATLYSVCLLILGIEYAVILGVIGALFNLIPYIGVLIAASLPIMLTLVSNTSPWLALLVLAMYVFIHFFDINFIVPRLVGSKVKINALVTIIAVISFGALWGIPGMILSIPLTGIIKLILDQTENLKPWGFLLGDKMPGSKKLFPRLTKHDQL